MIQELAAQGADQSFDVAVLPRRARGGDDFFDAQVFQAARHGVAVDAVAVADEVFGREEKVSGPVFRVSFLRPSHRLESAD